MTKKNPIICIVGPTASGKSSLGIEMAMHFGGEIINADSRQFYRELNIGTAKPSPSERQTVPHHLIDCASIESPWSVANFLSESEKKIQEIQQLGKIPVVVGGTGLYVKCLLFGLDDIPQIDESVREDLKKEMEEFGLEYLYEELSQCDPETASKLPPTDTHRILRALEIFRQTGKKIHEYWKGHDSPARYDYLKIGLQLERDVLYEQINKRVEWMLEKGLKEEAKILLEKYPQNTVLYNTIGYAEWNEFGFEQEDLVKVEIQKNTRHFAKRQLTWLRHEDDISWFPPDNKESIEKNIEMFIE